MGKPKASFRVQLSETDSLQITFWPTKNDPNAEVIVASIQRRQEDGWENIGRIAVYRSPEGELRQLPDRPPT